MTKDRYQIMLVEDNPADVYVIHQALERLAFPTDVHLAEDGEKAFQLIEKADSDPEGPGPDLLLLDLNVPRRNGKEILTRLRSSSRCGHIPVVVISSSDSPRELQALADLRFNHFFRKPNNYEEYLQLSSVITAVFIEASVSQNPGFSSPGQE